jgi:hypothetical protein
VVDHHVDRPGVQAQQCVELTGTNRSCELDRSYLQCSSNTPVEPARAGAPRTTQTEQLVFNPSFAGLVVLAGSLNPIPSRTRPLNSPAPMVLSLKTWKSRSLPGLPRTDKPHHDVSTDERPPARAAVFVCVRWPLRIFSSSLHARFQWRVCIGVCVHSDFSCGYARPIRIGASKRSSRRFHLQQRGVTPRNATCSRIDSAGPSRAELQIRKLLGSGA